MARIAFDLDDVLGNHTRQFVEFYNATSRKRRKLTFEEVTEYNLGRILGIGDDEFYGILNRFYGSEFFDNIQPEEGSQDTIGKIMELGYEVCVLTSRPKALGTQTRAWVKKYFEGIDPKQVLLSKEILPGPESLKGPVCKKRGIDLIVDDSLEQAISCASECAVLLFDRPWNQRVNIRLPRHVVRVNSWKELYKQALKY